MQPYKIQCTQCGEPKTLPEFGEQRSRTDGDNGYDFECRKCRTGSDLHLGPETMPGHYVAGADTNHFLGWCDECDAHYMSGMTLDTVDSWYRRGVLGQDAYEAYMHVWATSAPRFSSVGAGWERPPDSPRALAIVAVLREALAKRANTSAPPER